MLVLKNFEQQIIPMTDITIMKMTSTNFRTALDETGEDGSFVRRDASWRKWISSDHGAEFPPEMNRYHLYVAYGCPWAHRTLITRAIKGLEHVISVTTVMPVWQRTKPDDPMDLHCGWTFGDPSAEPFANSEGLGGPFPAFYPENESDPIFDAKNIRGIYEMVGDNDGKYTVPILFDRKHNTIVSNESSEIINMFNSEFNSFASHPEVDLEPEDLKVAMDDVNSWIYPNINNGVYRCGFAKSQEAYDKAINELTDAFDRVENILTNQRFIAGNSLTLSDIRLFVTLLRFDEVYVVYFKTNTRSVANSSVLLNYCREIYHIPGVAETFNMDQIKAHYYCSHPVLNKYSIIPKGPNFEGLLKQPHNRDALDLSIGTN